MRRRLSVPEKLGLFGLGLAPAAFVWPLATGLTGLGLPCPLRWLTGVPCPACGLTTASVALVRGDLAGAAAANPAVFLLAALAVAVGPLLVLRPIPHPVRARARTGWGIGLLAMASWAVQLHRLGIGRAVIPF
jgi:hypothetical protein